MSKNNRGEASKFSHRTLLKDIEQQLSEGWNCVQKIEAASHSLTSENDYTSDEHDFEELSFESILKRIYISLSLLIESLGYTSLLDDFKHDYAQFDGKLTRLTMLPHVGEFHSDVLGYFWQYYRTLSSLLGMDVQDLEDRKDRARLESILQNTAKIVFDRDVIPANEAEVRRCVYQLLIHVFPDTVREIPICQVTKTYKPDIGVRSLRAAAEYKYAATEEEAKKAIGGFYEDMRGYHGSDDWTHFYAVIYMTKPFFTLQQIQAEFSCVGVNPNWQPILVSGDGARKSVKK